MVDFKLTADGKIDVNSVDIELAAKDDPETCKKVEDFCAYLDAYQSSLSIPDTVVDDLNTLAAEIGKAAMDYGYIEGTKDAGKALVAMMQARTQMDESDQPTPSVTELTNAVREYIRQMSRKDMEDFGHDPINGGDQMLAALHTIDQLAAYDEEEARAAYFDFLDYNLCGMSFEIKN